LHRRPIVTLVLATWFLGSALAAVGQGLLSRTVARRSNWPVASGWQREIAAWNVALSFAVLRSLFIPHEPSRLTILRAIEVLSLLLALNHLAAIRRRARLLHMAAFLANASLAVLTPAVIGPRERAGDVTGLLEGSLGVEEAPAEERAAR
jgi:hypothetical protein